MTPKLDASRWLDNKTHSDIVIKSGQRLFRCHKVIVATASDYFLKLLDPEGAFMESSQGVIELKEDPEDAIEAVLRFIYTATYDDNNPDPLFHLRVFVAAQKYLLRQLQIMAKLGLRLRLQDLSSADASPETTAKIFECITSLTDHEEYDADFGDESNKLVKAHLVDLMELEEFRAWIVNSSATALETLRSAITLGKGMTKHVVVTCSGCTKVKFQKVGTDGASVSGIPSHLCDRGYGCFGTQVHTVCWVPDPKVD